MMEGGCHRTALTGITFMDLQAIGDIVPAAGHRNGTSRNPYPY
jgi:hypothetical protein